jgi:hypothetical protein
MDAFSKYKSYQKSGTKLKTSELQIDWGSSGGILG